MTKYKLGQKVLYSKFYPVTIEVIRGFTENGLPCRQSSTDSRKLVAMNLDQLQPMMDRKSYGWINIYIGDVYNQFITSGGPHPSKEKAMEFINENDKKKYINTFEVFKETEVFEDV